MLKNISKLIPRIKRSKVYCFKAYKLINTRCLLMLKPFQNSLKTKKNKVQSLLNDCWFLKTFHESKETMFIV